MSLQRGNTKIKDIYFGTKKIKKVYYGNKLVYDGTEIITPNEFYINASGSLVQIFFLSIMLPPRNSTIFPGIFLKTGMNIFTLPVTAFTASGASRLLNEGDTLHIYKGIARSYQRVHSIVLEKGQTYNLTF